VDRVWRATTAAVEAFKNALKESERRKKFVADYGALL
jgi:hypothetical protein